MPGPRRGNGRVGAAAFIAFLMVLGAVLGWTLGTWPAGRWPRSQPDPAVHLTNVAVGSAWQWAVPASLKELGTPPSQNPCNPTVRKWLTARGAVPAGLDIRFHLVSERPQSVSITGIRARPYEHTTKPLRTMVEAECTAHHLEYGEGEVYSLEMEVGSAGSGARAEGGLPGKSLVDLDLGKGDTLEFHIALTAKGPGGAERWTLELEFTTGDEKRYVPISGPFGSFVVAPPLPDNAPALHLPPR
ncbi:hypothetical protein [Streptomyces sp. NPDC002054]|uniref:hypothetical protein n=1 Tax=Streptomyces sp. NPDC002054 TaxID=3154663 RepID=UPI0033191A30